MFHITNPSFNPGTRKKKQAALAQQIFDRVGCVAALLRAGAVSTIVAAWSPGHYHVEELGSEVPPLGGFDSSPRMARLDLVGCILLSFLSKSEAASHAAAMVPKQAVPHLVQALDKRLALARGHMQVMTDKDGYVPWLEADSESRRIEFGGTSWLNACRGRGGQMRFVAGGRLRLGTDYLSRHKAGRGRSYQTRSEADYHGWS